MIRNKKWPAGLTGLIVFFTVICCHYWALEPASAAQITLKAVSPFPKTHPLQVTIPTLIKKVEANTNGRVEIKWLGGPEVIKTFDQADALKRGTIDMLPYYPFGYTKSLMPVAFAKGMSECTAWEERENGATALWDKLFQKHMNAKYLGAPQSGGGFYIYSKKKIEKLEDLKGLIIRVMPLYVPFLKTLGAKPIVMPPPEVYTALTRGVVDAVMWPIVISGFGWQEIVKYAVFPGLFQLEAGTLVNLDKWNTIPKDLQETIIKSLKEVEHLGAEEISKVAEKEWQTVKAAGVEIVEFSPEDAKTLREVAYRETWKEVMKMAPEHGQMFKDLTSPCKK